MISVADRKLRISEKENLSQCIIPKTLLLTRKGKYKHLRDSQKYRTIIIRKPDGHKYKFEFELNTEDTALSKMYLYQKNFLALPKNIVFLWVCSIRRRKTDSSEIVKIIDIDWHFSVVETNEELNCKHKGIISKLHKDDLLLSAGEIFIQDHQIQWNNITGCLKRSMEFNETRLESSFINTVMGPILGTFGHKFEYNIDLLKTHAPKITYDYCNRLYKQKILSCHKEKICKC